MDSYDLICIGGGTAGLGASRNAAVSGKRTLVVTDGPIGGDCTWTGCIPSKTLLAQSRQGATFREAIAVVHSTIAEIAATEDAHTLRSEGIDVVEGRGKLLGNGRVEVGGVIFQGEAVLIATGARAALPSIPGLSEVAYLTNHDVFDLSVLPERLGIIGGGPMGCEMAVAFAGFGCEVTIFDMADRLLPEEEPEASAVVERTLANAGISVRTQTSITRLAQRGPLRIVETGDEHLEVDELLIAAGRTPNIEGLGVEALELELDSRGHLVVNGKLQTSVDRVSAAGDVTGLAPFTHSADEQARLAAAYATGIRSRWRYDASATPSVTFTSPEVARVGVVEADAPRGSRVAYLSLEHVDRAITEGRTDGFVKLIAAPGRVTRHSLGGKLVGATIVADRAGEMIHGPVLAMRLGMYVGRLAQVTVPYPSWTTGIQQAAGMFFRPVSGQVARRARPRSGAATN